MGESDEEPAGAGSPDAVEPDRATPRTVGAHPASGGNPSAGLRGSSGVLSMWFAVPPVVGRLTAWWTRSASRRRRRRGP